MSAHAIRAGSTVYIGRSASDLADLVVDAETSALEAIVSEELLELYRIGEWWRGMRQCSGFRETFKRIMSGTIREYVVTDAGPNVKDPSCRDYFVLHEKGYSTFSACSDEFVMGCAKKFTGYLCSRAPSLGRLPVEGPWGNARDQAEHMLVALPSAIRTILREIRDQRSTIEGLLGLWDVEISRDEIRMLAHIPDRSEMQVIRGSETLEGWLVSNAMSLLLVEDFIGDNDLGSRITNLRRHEGLVPVGEPRFISEDQALVLRIDKCV